jgi:hypothetical protein
VVLGFPCSQFAQQEPEDESAIEAFCSTTYQITSPSLPRSTSMDPKLIRSIAGSSTRQTVCWAVSPSSGVSPSSW